MLEPFHTKGPVCNDFFLNMDKPTNNRQMSPFPQPIDGKCFLLGGSLQTSSLENMVVNI